MYLCRHQVAPASPNANGEAVAIRQNVSAAAQSTAASPPAFRQVREAVQEQDEGPFDVELTKDSKGLGITISGYTAGGPLYLSDLVRI